MRKVVVFGLGRFGASVATKLYLEGAEVLAIDRNLRLVEQIDDHVSAAVACDATEKANLTAYNIQKMDTAVVAIGNNFEASVLITLLCKEMGVPRIVAKALNPMQQKVLQELGADQVIMPEEEMGIRIAEHILHESVVDFVELPLGYSLRRIDVPEDWLNKSLAELDLPSSEGLVLIQIHRPRAEDRTSEPERITLPHAETVLQADDRIDLIGPDEVLKKFQ